MKAVYALILLSVLVSIVAESDLDIAEEVLQQSKEMWELVEHYGEKIELNFQDEYHEESDHEYTKLVESVDKKALEDDTVSRLADLLDVYKVDESDSDEVQDFLKDIFDTEVMKNLRKYLNESGEVDEEDFEKEFKRIWFDSYQLENEEEMTGFQRIFMGELNDTEVMGLNNWVRYYKEEDDDSVIYRGWSEKISLDKLNVVSVNFLWHNDSAAVSTIPFGTKPEYEMAIYTMCWYMMPGDTCHVYIGGDPVNVVTEVIEYDDDKYMRSARLQIIDDSDDNDDKGVSTNLRPDYLLSTIICACFLSKQLLAL